MRVIVERHRIEIHGKRGTMTDEYIDRIAHIKLLEDKLVLMQGERDEARREVCNNKANHLPTMSDPYREAKRRGWDCFKEKDK